MKDRITISRGVSGDGKPEVSIQIEEDATLNLLYKADMTIEDFALAILGRSCVPIERDPMFRDLGRTVLPMTDTKINLCDTCMYSFGCCSGDIRKFGDGVGNDNVVECFGYITKDRL